MANVRVNQIALFRCLCAEESSKGNGACRKAKRVNLLNYGRVVDVAEDTNGGKSLCARVVFTTHCTRIVAGLCFVTRNNAIK